MRVGAHHGRDPPIQKPAHGDFFAGGFGVEIEENHRCLLAQGGDFLVESQERILDGRVGESAAHGIHDGHLPLAGIEDDAALAWRAGGEIQRAQQAGLRFHVSDQFMLIPTVIPEGHHGGSRTQQTDT